IAISRKRPSPRLVLFILDSSDPTRRGICLLQLVSDEFCREPCATYHEREYNCRTRGRRRFTGDRNTRNNHVAPFVVSNSQRGDSDRLSGKYPEKSLESITHRWEQILDQGSYVSTGRNHN